VPELDDSAALTGKGMLEARRRPRTSPLSAFGISVQCLKVGEKLVTSIEFCNAALEEIRLRVVDRVPPFRAADPGICQRRLNFDPLATVEN
jgi:hypothetical protein